MELEYAHSNGRSTGQQAGIVHGELCQHAGCGHGSGSRRALQYAQVHVGLGLSSDIAMFMGIASINPRPPR